VTRMLTRDMFAVANLLVSFVSFSAVFWSSGFNRRRVNG